MIPARAALTRYLESAFPGSSLEPLAGDASSRRFFRLRLPDSTTRVIMDYGGAFEGETPDMRVAALFGRACLPAAPILAVAPDPGCLILGDLGDRTLQRTLAAIDPVGRRDLYRRAIELIAALQIRGTLALRETRPGRWPVLDAGRFRYEMDFFLEHYARGLRGLERIPPELPGRLHELADRAAATPRSVLCHRDFHSRNLMVREDGSLAMVDIQDARWGPDAYDLASLVRDAYVEMDEEEAKTLVEAYLESDAAPSDGEAFLGRFEIVAAQRMIKALGTFGYQAGTLGRDRYREAIPRAVKRLRRLLPASEATAGLGATLLEAGLLEVC